MTNDKGQVLVETAMVLPILVLFLFGIVDFSRYLYTINTLSNAARAGARAAALQVTPPLPVQGAGVASPANSIERAVSDNLAGIVRPEGVTYALEIKDMNGTTVTRAAQTGDELKITVDCPGFQLQMPLIRNIFTPVVPCGASMRRE